MPITKSAKKALRVAARRRVFNLRRKEAMKKAIRSVEKLVSEKKIKEATTALSNAYAAIDKAAKRGVIKANAAARKKSRLAASLKRAGA